jgi:hypothetical protein
MEDKTPPPKPAIVPRDYTDTPNQPRVRPQWDAVELARKYLDDMEKGGRLHLRLKRDKPA